MVKLIVGLLVGIGFIFIVGLLSIVGGTFVWLIWPTAIPAAFPGLVASGVLAAKLSWWVSVCLTWLCGLLLKSSLSKGSSKS